MRKKIFLVIAVLTTFLFTAAPSLSAPSNSKIGDPRELPRGRENATRILNEATERGLKATPPGLLRQKIATLEGKLNILRRHVYNGTVSEISTANRSFTLSTKNGSKTVQTNDETSFFKTKFKNGLTANFETLKVGDRAIAVGRIDEEGLMTARWVIIIPAKEPQIKRRAVYGVVEQKVATDSATLLTLRHPKTQKTYQVVVNAQTKITGKGLINPTATDIQIGNRVAAVGTVDEAGKITAKRLHIIPGLARGLFGTQPSTPSSRRLSPTPTPTPTP